MWASIERAAKDVTRELFEEALRRDPTRQRQWVVLIDGDPHQLARIQATAARYQVSVTIVMDFIHVLEYVWDAARAFYPGDSVAAAAWVQTQALRILQGEVRKVAKGMRLSATMRELSGQRRDAVDTSANYLAERHSFLRYDLFLEQGFPIALGNPFRKDEIIANMQLMRQSGTATVHRTRPSFLLSRDAHLSPFERIRERGILRAGYLPDNLPFAFFNAADKLVGFDVEMAYILARDLGLALEFVPIERDQMASQLNVGACDLIMSGVAVTPERAQQMAFTQSYLNQTMAFLVKDHRREDFNRREAIQGLKSPRIGVLNVPYYTDKLKRYLPQAEIVKMRSVTEFLQEKGAAVDAFLYTAEAGSAWSLLYPAYTVAIPQPDVLTGPLAYAVAQDNAQLINFLNIWIDLKKQDRTIDGLYDYWILGKNAVPKSPRWSVIRNVLGWVE